MLVKNTVDVTTLKFFGCRAGHGRQPGITLVRVGYWELQQVTLVLP